MSTKNLTHTIMRFLPGFLAMLAVSMVCVYAAGESGLRYDFASDAQGWRYMGLYDGTGLTPLPDFLVAKNPWTHIDGDWGALIMGQQGFTTQSQNGYPCLHGDLNSPDLNYQIGKLGAATFSFDVTGAHMASTARVLIQAVITVRKPNEISDRLYRSEYLEVPLGDDGAWETHSFSVATPSGTFVKKISLRVYFETSAVYWGWIMADNVTVR